MPAELSAAICRFAVCTNTRFEEWRARASSRRVSCSRSDGTRSARELAEWAATAWNVSAVEVARGGGKSARLVVIDRFLPASCAARWRDVLAASWAREAPCRGGGGGGGGGAAACGARAPPSWLCATSDRGRRG